MRRKRSKKGTEHVEKAKGKKPRVTWSLDDLKKLVDQIDGNDLDEALADYPEVDGSCYFSSGVLPRIRLLFISVRVRECKKRLSDLEPEHGRIAQKILSKIVKKRDLKVVEAWAEDNYVVCVVSPKGKSRDRMFQTAILGKRTASAKPSEAEMELELSTSEVPL